MTQVTSRGLELLRQLATFRYLHRGQIKKRLPATIDFKIHRARNTALTNWRRAGVDIATLAKLAGHSDIAHTEHHLGDITPEEIARVPDAFGQFYGRKAV